MRRWWVVGIILAAAGLLAACGQDTPARTVAQGDVLYRVTFDAPGAWEEGRYPTDAAAPDAVLAIQAGRYQIDFRAGGSASFTWGAGGDPAPDVIIEVQTEQLSAGRDNLYGVACRLAPDAQGSVSGYVLLISGDGHYGIAQLTRTSLIFLLDWHQSRAIRQGQAHNSLRAICVDDYLALYANGEFLGEVTLKHSPVRQSGQVGLVVGAAQAGEVSIAFDDLAVYAGSSAPAR